MEAAIDGCARAKAEQEIADVQHQLTASRDPMQLLELAAKLTVLLHGGTPADGAVPHPKDEGGVDAKKEAAATATPPTAPAPPATAPTAPTAPTAAAADAAPRAVADDASGGDDSAAQVAPSESALADTAVAEIAEAMEESPTAVLVEKDAECEEDDDDEEAKLANAAKKQRIG